MDDTEVYGDSFNINGPNDWYRAEPGGVFEGGGTSPFMDQGNGYSYPPASFSMPPAGSGNYSSSGGRSGSFTGLYPWESEDWKPSFGPTSDFGGAPGPRMNPLGPRQLAPTSPSRPPPNLGSPERTLYDRYSGLLQNPSGFSSDPAYQFLFNQGMQAFNRTAAANRMRFAGKTMDDSMKYGQGLAYDYMNRMLPQYKAGADEELQRWAVPGQLQLQGYGLDQGNVRLAQSGTALNNNERGEVESGMAAQDLIPQFSQAYTRMMSSPSGYGGYDAPSYGGISYGRRLV